MASNDSGVSLQVRISADLQDIKQGLGLLRGELAKVKHDAENAQPNTSGWENGIGRLREELIKLAGAYVGIHSVVEGVRSLFDAVDRMNHIEDLSQITGISAETLSKLAYAAQFSATNIDSLAAGVSKLSKGLVENDSLLRALGISTRDAAGNFRKVDDILLDVADLFASLPDGPERAALAIKLFGKTGTDLLPFLTKGRAGLAALMQEAIDTGNAFDANATAAAAEFNDNLARLRLTAQGVANVAAQKLVPGISAYAESAANAGRESSVAAESGAMLANVLKVLAAAGIVVKNVFESAVNVLAFFVTTQIGMAKVVRETVAAAISGKNPITAFMEAASQFGTETKNGFSAMKDGISDSIDDVLRIGKLFDETAQKSDNATDATSKTNDELRKRVAALLSTAKAVAALADSTALAQDALKRQLAVLNDQFADKQIGINDYFKKRVELQQQLIDLQIKQAQSELTVAKQAEAIARAQPDNQQAINAVLEKRRELEEKITILQRDRADAATQAAREEKRAYQESYDARASSLTGTLSAQEGAISAQIQAGTLGTFEGERQLQNVRRSTLEQLRQLRKEQAAYFATLNPGSAEYLSAQQALLGIDTSIANISASLNELRQGTQDAGVNAISNFFMNLYQGAMTAREALAQLFADFAQGIYEMLVQATSRKLVGAISDLFGGANADTAGDVGQGAAELTAAATATGIAGAVVDSAAAALSASAKELLSAATTLLVANSASTFAAAHGGGKAGSPRMFRNGISPMVFGAAPRYHTGGVAGLGGLANDEVAAILRRGETVRTQEQEAALQRNLDGARRSSDMQVPKPIIVFGEDQLADALAGSAGEKVVVMHVRNNRTQING